MILAISDILADEDMKHAKKMSALEAVLDDKTKMEIARHFVLSTFGFYENVRGDDENQIISKLLKAIERYVKKGIKIDDDLLFAGDRERYYAADIKTAACDESELQVYAAASEACDACVYAAKGYLALASGCAINAYAMAVSNFFEGIDKEDTAYDKSLEAFEEKKQIRIITKILNKKEK